MTTADNRRTFTVPTVGNIRVPKQKPLRYITTIGQRETSEIENRAVLTIKLIEKS